MAKKSVKKAATAAAKKSVKRPAKPAAKAGAKSAAAPKKKPLPVSKAAQTKSKVLNGKPKSVMNVTLAKSAKKGLPVVIPSKGSAVTTKTAITIKKAAAPQVAILKKGSTTATKVIPSIKESAKVAVPVKSGRPMLLQGPIAIRPMGKKATLFITPEKPKAKAVKRRPPYSSEPSFVVVQPPTKAVATSEKAAKNKAGFHQKDLDFFRDLLLAKRRELVGDMSSMEREALRENSSDLSNLPVHMADQGTDAYEQEFTLHLVEKDRTLLRELNDALAKIQNGTYGICEGTGLPISKPRLEAQPWARHSIEHARALEKRAGMFRR